MKIDVLTDASAVARKGAAIIAQIARDAIDHRGRFIMAVSGGNTPWQMLRVLAAEDIAWDKVHIAQVDERVAPFGDAERNLTHLRDSLGAKAPPHAAHVHPMPVEEAPLVATAMRYALLLARLAGSPPVLDLVQLGLGLDGHTASLMPGDPVIDIEDMDVAVTGTYQGRRRMTLTYSIINRARFVLWVVTGAAKAQVLERFHRGDAELPASRINRDHALLLADRDAAASLIDESLQTSFE